MGLCEGLPKCESNSILCKLIHAVGDADVQEYLRTEALAAIQFSVQPGFQSLVDFLENEYLPNLRPGELYQHHNNTPAYQHQHTINHL